MLARWGEYFVVVATSIFLPLEVYDLATKGVTSPARERLPSTWPPCFTY